MPPNITCTVFTLLTSGTAYLACKNTALAMFAVSSEKTGGSLVNQVNLEND